MHLELTQDADAVQRGCTCRVLKPSKGMRVTWLRFSVCSLARVSRAGSECQVMPLQPRRLISVKEVIPNRAGPKTSSLLQA